MNQKVDDYIANLDEWQKEIGKLREIALDCGLTEEWKWRGPCYSFNGKNILIIGGFKSYCAFSFFKGSLLSDPYKMLVAPGENSHSAKLFKFVSIEEIRASEEIIKTYVHEAIEVEKAGLKVQFKAHTEYEVPEELESKFKEDSNFKDAFEALTPGRQKGYLLHFSSAKQSNTRTSRIEKYMPRIKEGLGFHDCVCGLSKKHPKCDGSHKSLV